MRFEARPSVGHTGQYCFNAEVCVRRNKTSDNNDADDNSNREQKRKPTIHVGQTSTIKLTLSERCRSSLVFLAAALAVDPASRSSMILSSPPLCFRSATAFSSESFVWTSLMVYGSVGFAQTHTISTTIPALICTIRVTKNVHAHTCQRNGGKHYLRCADQI